MARIFIAIEMGGEARAELLRLQGVVAQRLGDSIRLVPPEQLHLTLIFLGEIDESRVAAAVDAARRSTDVGGCAALGPAGVFPAEGAVGVIWTGLTDPAGRVSRLAEKLAQELRNAGFTIEDRPFTPHVTLGRCRGSADGRRERAVVDALKVAPAPVPVESITVFRSERGGAGSRHIPVATIPLRSSGELT